MIIVRFTAASRFLIIVVLILASVLLAGESGLVASPAGGEPAPDLFADAGAAGSLDRTGEATIQRSRYVDVNFDLLVGEDGTPEGLDSGSVLGLNLFDDVYFSVVLERVERPSPGSFAWIGHVEGVALSQVILVIRGELLAGNIAMPGAFYQVRYAGGVHAVYEIDQSAFPPELEPVPVDIPEEGADVPLADDGSIIDVLVVYTDDARAVMGTAAMQILIDLAVAETNASYGNSGITQRLNLVHTAEVSYPETGDLSTALTRLRGTSDGFMDNVHSLRDTYCADEVVLIVDDGGAYCGIAYQMETVSLAFADRAFAVVADECATGYYSFGHELGHNMGARHDWYVDGGIAPYPHSHGYVNVQDRWRTIMAYNTECADDGGGNCYRLQYWSNPDVYYGGDPMGVPEGTSTDCAVGESPNCDADNRKTLNKTAFTVANFRESCSGNSPPHAPSDPSPADGASGVSATTDLSWSGGDPDAGDSVTYDVYLEANDATPDVLICNDVSTTVCDPGTLAYGTHFYWYVVATDNHGASTTGATWGFYTESVPPVVGPLVYDRYVVDDDNIGDSQGNDNGIVECGETIELYVDLHNQGTGTASGVVAGVSTSDPYVTWLYNPTSNYADIAGGATERNINDFDFTVAADTPHARRIQFDLDITASSGGPWSDSFQVLVMCSGPADHAAYMPVVFKDLRTFDGLYWDFDGSAPGWMFHSGTWWFDSDAWLTTDGIPDLFASASYAADFADFEYEAKLWRNGCDNCANVLIVRGTPYPLDGDNYWDQSYLFQYTRNGYYSVWKTDAGTATSLQDWATSPAIIQGDDWNVLRVGAIGANLYFHINETLVWTGFDSSLSSGRVGIGMYRRTDTDGDQLWADWATLSTLGGDAVAGEVSPEQQGLNDAASKPGGESVGYAPANDQDGR